MILPRSACSWHKNLPFGQAADVTVLLSSAFLIKQLAVLYHWPFLAFHDLSEHSGTEEVFAIEMGQKRRTFCECGQDHTKEFFYNFTPL